MIPPPPENARPTLAQAVLWPFFISFGLAIGTAARAIGAEQAIDWQGTIFGQLIVTAIVAAPFLLAFIVKVLSANNTQPLPGGIMLWGDASTLFFRAVRASLFMCGFVVVYLIVSSVALGQTLQPWAIGALTNAVMTLSWFGFLQIGPWNPKRAGRE
jgi:hypothetical protein